MANEVIIASEINRIIRLREDDSKWWSLEGLAIGENGDVKRREIRFSHEEGKLLANALLLGTGLKKTGKVR